MILKGSCIAEEMKEKQIQKVKRLNFKNKFIAILCFGDNQESKTYIKMKKKYGSEIGINVEIFGQEKYIQSENNQLLSYKIPKYKNKNEIINLIDFLNKNKNCIGVIVQLPLPQILNNHKAEILANIDPSKDIDGQGGKLFGMASIDFFDFLPATPKSVITLLKYYKLDNYKGKTIAILGQSNLVGKPLALELIKKGATIYSTNHYNDKEKIKKMCKLSDYIISCTGSKYLINEEYVRNDKTQIIVDVGYGYKNGKPVGDVNLENIKNLVNSYSPVPGGIGPLTVACLFENIFELYFKLKNVGIS